jgi:outer membrane usher protein
VPHPTGIGYQLSAATGAVNRATASLQGRASFGTLDASYTNLGGEQSTLLEAAGSVVVIGGKVYLTRPLRQSFAVLSVPGVANVRGYLNNREIGNTDSEGDLFVPDLAAYRRNLLRINQADLPIEYAFVHDEIAVAPMSRGGVVIEFAVHRVRLARGRIVRGESRHADSVPYGTLSVETPGGTLTSPLGNDGEFELDGLPEGRWRARVEAEELRCEVLLDLPATDAVVHYLGTLSCVAEIRPQVTP